MNRSITKFIRGFVSRKFRKLFHKKWDVVDHGAKYFQEFSDIYSDTINDMDTAERFFKDFMEETQGWVIVDFIDTDNWDCIRQIEVDKENRLIWFFWQIPSGDILEEEMRRMIFPFGYYGICLKFDNVRFVQTTSGSEMFEQIMNIGPDDVLIAISFPRYSKRIINAVEYASEAGADVISITDSHQSPIASGADQLLLARSDMVSFVDSLVAPLSIINAMIVAVARKKPDEIRKRLEKLEQIWDEYDVYDKTQG